MDTTISASREVVDPEVSAACARAAKGFRELGARVDEVRPGGPRPRRRWEEHLLRRHRHAMAPYLPTGAPTSIPACLPIIERTLKWPPTRYLQAWFDRLAW